MREFKNWVIDDLLGADIKKILETDMLLYLRITRGESYYVVQANESDNTLVCISDDKLELVKGDLTKETWNKIYNIIK